MNAMEKFVDKDRSLCENNNEVGVSIAISSAYGKTSILVRSRKEPGGPVKEFSTEDASETQIMAVWSILDAIGKY